MAQRYYDFEWDIATIDHIARHGVEPEEVEEVFIGWALIRTGRDGRSVAWGETAAGRRLTIVFEIRSRGVVRVITARPMNQAERRRYRRERRH